MGATRDRVNGDAAAASVRPTYEELVAENRRLHAQVQGLQVQVQGLQVQVQELTLLVEKLRRENKRQAAPFRKQDGPVAEPKKPGRKSGRRHGPHVHRGVPPRIDETYD